MFIDGTKLAKHIVTFVEREKFIQKEVEELNDRYSTAINLNNQRELRSIEYEGEKLAHKFKMFITEKVMVMSMYIGRNRRYNEN